MSTDATQFIAVSASAGQPGHFGRFAVRNGMSLRGSIRMAFAKRRTILFAGLCLFVGLVSVHDAMLIVFNHEIIYEVEQNPVGRWLMEAQDGEIWLFVIVKLAGTAVVCAVLISLYRFRPRFALIVAVAIAGFQAGLLYYLTFV